MVSQNRGQLLLLGGLAIAIVLLVAIPLANSLVVTQSASSSETVTEIDSVAREEAAIDRSVNSIVDRSDSVEELKWGLQNYSATRTRVRGTSNGVYVNVTVNKADSEGAERLQTDGSDFDDPGTGGSTNWQVVDSADAIGSFNLTIEDANNPASPSAGAFTIEIIGDSGDVWRLRAYRTSPSGPLTVETQEGSDPWQTACTGSTPVEVDIEAGTCTISGSTVPLPSEYTGSTNQPHRIEVTKGNNAGGDYRFTGRGDFSATGGENSAYPAIPAIDISYVGPDASYNRTIIAEEGI